MCQFQGQIQYSVQQQCKMNSSITTFWCEGRGQYQVWKQVLIYFSDLCTYSIFKCNRNLILIKAILSKIEYDQVQTRQFEVYKPKELLTQQDFAQIEWK